MTRSLLSVAVAVSLVVPAPAQSNIPEARQPAAWNAAVLPLDQVELVAVPGIDVEAALAEDQTREAQGLPRRYAIPHATSLTPDLHGTWESLDEKTLLWRLRVLGVDAVSINLGFDRFSLPDNTRLLMYSADYKQIIRPFTAADNEDHGQLWTPVLRTDEVVLELVVPDVLIDAVDLRLAHIGYGYRGFGVKAPGDIPGFLSGSCNVDVVCPDGDGWENEIASVAVISINGFLTCTGFMVNNTANDRTPYFMTANHCGLTSGNASTLVTYWNYETSVCGGTPDGTLSDFMTGSLFRSSYSPSDFTLVELDDTPPDAFGITFAGWDRSGADESGATAIHHPAVDEKRISFEFDPTSTTSYLGNSSPGDGTHIRVLDWDTGTTEGGSSGSPLFNPDHQVVGQLHGGFAACGNDDADWYGKIFVSWDGGGSASSRLSDWLDPLQSGATSIDTLGVGLTASPSGATTHEGPVGGPFSNDTMNYTLKNNTLTPLDYRVELTNDVGILIDGGTGQINGTLAAGATAVVVASLDTSVNSLPAGVYNEQIVITDVTNGLVTVRDHTIEIGRTMIFDFPLDADPGWTEEGRWDYGSPSGGGGQHGNPDPVGGFTGPNCYGFELNGDYNNNLVERSLITPPLDFSSMSGVKLSFMRWLNVEQPLYDHAYIRVSTDGVNFTTIWENGSEITDNSWSLQEYDVSELADGQANVQIAWVMGTTDSSWQYSGWNVDDVTFSAIPIGGFTEYGTGLAGSGGFVPQLSGSGDTSVGGLASVDLTGCLGGSSGVYAFSDARADLPFLGGSLLVNPPFILVPIAVGGAAGVPGAGELSLGVSFDAGLAGVIFDMQALMFDAGAPAGVSMSNGLEVEVGS